jgi:hypothetical protein
MNRYGIPVADERAIRARYVRCVYCRKEMQQHREGVRRGDWATLEHLNYMPPWNNPSTVVMCCWSCNSSRGNKPLLVWFQTRYCREARISLETVPEEVRAYVLRHEMGA